MWGGVISHNLGEQFRSPTVNLFISGDQFFPFVKGIRFYLSEEAELTQVEDNSRSYPVGRLHPANDSLEDIFIYFQHYKTFEDAKEKWLERSRRVNWDNIYYIWEFYEGLHNYEHLREFDALKIKKIILLHGQDESVQNAFVIDEGEVVPGKILNYDDSGVKRYLDQFDYVSFLNT